MICLADKTAVITFTLRGGSLDFRARLAMRRAACSERTVACGAIPALLVTLPDIDLYTTEVMQD